MRGCFPCEQNALLPDLPPREAVVVEGRWRVAHAFDTSLEGWLVVVPLLHVEALEELTEQDAADLGRLLHRCSVALRELTGCVKSYVMAYGEAQGFSHLHVHVVPRAADLSPDLRGPRVFGLLGRTDDALSPERRDEVALALRELLPT